MLHYVPEFSEITGRFAKNVAQPSRLSTNPMCNVAWAVTVEYRPVSLRVHV